MNAENHRPIRLSREQVRRVDRLAVVKYQMSGLVLMENAGRGAAEAIHRECRGASSSTILCGIGNNGGDGLVIARHLHNFGWSVRLLILGDPLKMTPDTAANFRIATAMRLPFLVSTDWQACLAYLQAGSPDEVLVDAILGTGFTGEVRPPLDRVIQTLPMVQPRTVVAIDVPSGLDADTGFRSNATVKADLTITFVAEKTGFSLGEAALFLGRVRVVDIGAPRELVDEVRISQGET